MGGCLLQPITGSGLRWCHESEYDDLGRVTSQSVTAGYTDASLSTPLAGRFEISTSYAQMNSGAWEMTMVYPTGMMMSRRLDLAGRAVHDELAPLLGTPLEIAHQWSAGNYNGAYVGDFTRAIDRDGFGAPAHFWYDQDPVGGPFQILLFHEMERGVLGRVRESETSFHHAQPSGGPHKLWWKGNEYDLRGALTGSWEMVAPDASAVASNTVGYHDSATDVGPAFAH